MRPERSEARTSGELTRVLLIDDDEEDFLLTRDLLDDAGGTYRLEHVRTFEEGLDAIKRNAHDVYLVDFNLGSRNGLDLLREAPPGGAPIIILTGATEREVDYEAMRAGAADFLVKGRIDPDIIERAIRYAIGRHRSDAALRTAHQELERRVEERTAALSNANAELAEAAKRNDEFLAMLAHELRNPLATIRTSSHLLGRSSLEPTAVRAREMIERQVRHLTRLVDDLLDVSRITRGKISIRRERLDLVELVKLAIQDLPSASAASSLTVELPGEPVWISGDATRLTQTIHNLLDNAVKFGDPGGLITLRVVPSPTEVSISIRDEGIGIEPEMINRIFDPFAQSDRSLDRSKGGLGIGLALVKGLVALHGGRVSVSSEGPGRGSVFTITLPRELRESASPASIEPVPLPTTRLKVLVIEDNADAAESLRSLLELCGHDTVSAHSGIEGVRMAVEERPDAVLCDIGLPELDGFGVAAALRKNPDLAHVKLIALSGYGCDVDRVHALEAGFDEYLVKPADPDELLRRLADDAGRA